MQLMRSLLTLFVWFIVFSLQPSAFANPEKIEGLYKVEQIESASAKDFEIAFVNTANIPRKLVLNTSAMPKGLKVGASYRLLAYLLPQSKKTETPEILQCLIYIPSEVGPVPVWLLSKSASKLNLGQAPFLKMHAPSSDYHVL